MATTQKKTKPQSATSEKKDGNHNHQENDQKAKAGLLNSASKIVFKAAGILEEEIAKGIVAARQVEEKYSDVSKLRNGKGTLAHSELEQLIKRFRKDAHDIFDLVLDFATIAAANVEKVSSQIISIRRTTDKNGEAENGVERAMQHSNLTLIQVQQSLSPGQQITVPLDLQNDNLHQQEQIEIVNSPFVSSEGKQLKSEILKFQPNPFALAPGQKVTIQCAISVPDKASPGTYTSFVEGKGMKSLKATLMITII